MSAFCNIQIRLVTYSTMNFLLLGAGRVNFLLGQNILASVLELQMTNSMSLAFLKLGLVLATIAKLASKTERRRVLKTQAKD